MHINNKGNMSEDKVKKNKDGSTTKSHTRDDGSGYSRTTKPSGGGLIMRETVEKKTWGPTKK